MQVDHIGVAVRSVDAAADRLCALLGYARRTTKVANSRHKVTVLFLRKENSIDIKLFEPLGEDSPTWDFVRKGGGLHHIGFKVPNVFEACAELEQKRARVIVEPEPGEAFDGHPIAFLFLGLGLNVEVIDTAVRAGELEEPAA